MLDLCWTHLVIYEDQIKKKMSRADFYILTAVTALDESPKFNNANLTSSFNENSPTLFFNAYNLLSGANSLIWNLSHLINPFSTTKCIKKKINKGI